MLTKEGIVANPNKGHAIINMIKPSNVKEVHQLTRNLATLYHFLSYASDKAFNFVTTLKKKEKFE